MREDDNNQEILALFDGVSEGQGQLRAWRALHIFGLLRLRRFHKSEIFFAELQLYRLQVPDWVNRVIDVDHLLRLKGAHNVENAVHRLDIGQKGIA